MIVDEEVEVFLEHHGVKGMKWGVRQQHKRIDALKKVSKGQGSFRDKTQVFVETPLHTLHKGKGIKGAAKIRLKQETINDRVSKGKRAVTLLAAAGLMALGVAQIQAARRM